MERDKQSDEEKAGAEARLRPFLLAVALGMVAVYMLIVADTEHGSGISFLKVAILSALGLGCGVASYLFLGRTLTSGMRPAEAIDPLSRILGRGAFLDALEREIARTGETGKQLALHIVDLDGFALVNQVAGEAAGTALLRDIAQRLIGIAGDAGQVARIGDDEFAVLQPRSHGTREAELRARDIMMAVQNAALAIPAAARPTGSIGVAVAPGPGIDGERLMRNASLALADAKKAGGVTRIYAREMEMVIEARRKMRLAVAQALDEGWFELHYQPQYDLEGRRLTGFEALVRMDHPEIGFLMPSAFLPIIEEDGLLQRLGDWIIRTAISTAAEWPDGLALSVNIAAGQIRDGDLTETVAAALETAGFRSDQLRLEVPESVFVSPDRHVVEQCHRLKDLGALIVIEDFGLTGSNLQAMAQARCDAIKIDRSLMSHVGEDTEADALVRGLIRTAHGFGLAVYAEGIERAEQALFLASNDCWTVQGYLFGRPVPAADLAAIIAKDFRNSLRVDRDDRADRGSVAG